MSEAPKGPQRDPEPPERPYVNLCIHRHTQEMVLETCGETPCVVCVDCGETVGHTHGIDCNCYDCYPDIY